MYSICALDFTNGDTNIEEASTKRLDTPLSDVDGILQHDVQSSIEPGRWLLQSSFAGTYPYNEHGTRMYVGLDLRSSAKTKKNYFWSSTYDLQYMEN